MVAHTSLQYIPPIFLFKKNFSLNMHGFYEISKIIRPLAHGKIKGTYTSKSHKLFVELGLTQMNNGIGTLLPFTVRSLRKLETLVRQKMEEISALEIVLPTLTEAKLFEKSGKIHLPELFKLKDRHDKEFVLSPTNEESVTHLLSSVSQLTEHHLPCRLYQISKKFRDEKRVKSGLLRSKEFIMKDLYCFESSEERNQSCYDEVLHKYHEIFQFLKVPYICAKGEPGHIGGSISHEFHFLSNAGEDKIVSCRSCNYGENLNNTENANCKACPKCGSLDIEIVTGIEVGHTFNLGTKYTEIFNVNFLNNSEANKSIHMSCFGLGLTRILAASVEILSKENEIRWPVAFAPYLICIIPPKAGSKEEEAAGNNLQLIYQHIKECWSGEVVMDNRVDSTIGKRLKEAKEIGFPFVIIIGKKISEQPPLVEIHDINSGSVNFVQISGINQFLLDRYQAHIEGVSEEITDPRQTEQKKNLENVSSVNR